MAVAGKLQAEKYYCPPEYKSSVGRPAKQQKERLQLRTKGKLERQKEVAKNSVACTHFGCKSASHPMAPIPVSIILNQLSFMKQLNSGPAVPPRSKACDWDDFQSILSCQSRGICFEVKDERIVM